MKSKNEKETAWFPCDSFCATSSMYFFWNCLKNLKCYANRQIRQISFAFKAVKPGNSSDDSHNTNINIRRLLPDLIFGSSIPLRYVKQDGGRVYDYGLQKDQKGVFTWHKRRQKHKNNIAFCSACACACLHYHLFVFILMLCPSSLQLGLCARGYVVVLKEKQSRSFTLMTL